MACCCPSVRPPRRPRLRDPRRFLPWELRDSQTLGRPDDHQGDGYARDWGWKLTDFSVVILADVAGASGFVSHQAAGYFWQEPVQQDTLRGSGRGRHARSLGQRHPWPDSGSAGRSPCAWNNKAIPRRAATPTPAPRVRAVSRMGAILPPAARKYPGPLRLVETGDFAR